MAMVTEDKKIKLARLNVFERKLESLLPKIDKEINQTEVEWLHLKSLIEAHNNPTIKPNVQLNTEEKLVLESKNNPFTINESMSMELNLNPSFNVPTQDEEFDSD